MIGCKVTAMTKNETFYPVKLQIPVAWGEMDAFGHVNNIIYLRYFENVRIHYFHAIKMPVYQPGVSKVGPILANAHCDFLRPVTFPDTVQTEVGCNHVGNSSFNLVYRIWSDTQQQYVAKGETVVVYFDYQAGASTPLTEDLRANIAALEETGSSSP
jgi:acyl-CoA thioester hydrolase